MTPAVGVDPYMTPEERAKVLDWLEESRREFLSAIEDVSEEQWTWRPAPDRWSIAETAEHVVLGEALLFACVRKAISSPANSNWQETSGKTEIIERLIAPRRGRAQAPKSLLPEGKFTPTQIRERFERQRAGIVEFSAETQLALKQHTVDHPFPVFGTLNAYQWLIYLPLHTMRHKKQMAEVKTSAGYP